MTFALIPNTVCLIILSLAIPLAFAGGISVPASNPQSTVNTAKASTGLLGGSTLSKPLWTELSAAQKQALAPLSPEWDKMSELGKKKWLGIADRYATMKPDEQARLQERMRDWVKLTPEQRMAARENYAKSTQLKPEHKSAQWQQYQQLSEEEKKRLADENQKKKSVTNLPSESVKNPKILAPIKVGPTPPTTSAPAVKVITPPAAVLVTPAAPVTPAASVAATPPAATATDTTAASVPASQNK
ncbi:DUF3106 domain-containing protein [Undibacterium sp. TC4M20W]|uniref:DUF3106 domain-containing protein n=1 Tax=Undibacterium sp. TC4M20W TaxID=3413052 RepID=UPI003BF0AB7F